MTDGELKTVRQWLVGQVDWYESEAQRIEKGNDFAELTGELKIARDNVRMANCVRRMIGVVNDQIGA